MEIGRPRALRVYVNDPPGAEEPAQADEVEQLMQAEVRSSAGRVRQAQAERTAAQIKLEEAEIEDKMEDIQFRRIQRQREMREMREGDKGKADGVTEQLIAAMLADTAHARDKVNDLVSTLTQTLGQRIEQQRSQDAAEPPKMPSLMDYLEQIQSVEAFLDRFRGPHGDTPPPADVSNLQATLQIEKMRTELQIERLKAESAERRADKEHDLQLRRLEVDLEGTKVRSTTEAQRNERMAEVVEKLGPAAVAAFQEAVLHRPSGTAGTEGTAALPGRIPVTCNNPECAKVFLVRGDEQAVACPHCHLLHVKQGSQPPQVGGNGHAGADEEAQAT